MEIEEIEEEKAEDLPVGNKLMSTVKHVTLQILLLTFHSSCLEQGCELCIPLYTEQSPYTTSLHLVVSAY